MKKPLTPAEVDVIVATFPELDWMGEDGRFDPASV